MACLVVNILRLTSLEFLRKNLIWGLRGIKLINPITGGVSEHPITGGVMKFCITLDISTTTNAKTLKLGQDMH